MIVNLREITVFISQSAVHIVLSSYLTIVVLLLMFLLFAKALEWNGRCKQQKKKIKKCGDVCEIKKKESLREKIPNKHNHATSDATDGSMHAKKNHKQRGGERKIKKTIAKKKEHGAWSMVHPLKIQIPLNTCIACANKIAPLVFVYIFPFSLPLLSPSSLSLHPSLPTPHFTNMFF